MAVEPLQNEVDVAPKSAIGQHHALGESGGAAGVVDERQFVGLVYVIVHVLGAEVFGVFVSEYFVEVLACKGQFVGARDDEREVGNEDDAFQVGHLIGGDGFGHVVANEEQFSFRVVDNVVHLLGIELMQNKHCHGAIGERGQEGDSPVGAVSSANSNLVAFGHSTILKEDVQFLYLSCDIVKLERCSLIVCQCILIPIFYDAILNIRVEAWY